MSRQNQAIGIVGAAGSLGSKLANIAMESGFEIYCFDISNTRKVKNNNHIWQDNLEDLVAKSSIIHWCAPSEAATHTLVEFPADKTLVLHESVMNFSDMARSALRRKNSFEGNATIVHCLMNDERTVVIDESSDNNGVVAKHIRKLGLRPIHMNVNEHDRIMARTQAPFAVLHELLVPELKILDKKGLLTPSGKALHLALEDRSAKWTGFTLKSILGNPQLPGFMKEMNDFADKLRKQLPN